jgi:hypothetical protein
MCGFSTIMYIRPPPRPLAIPKKAQVHECCNVVFNRVFDFLESKLSSLLGPLRTESMFFEVVLVLHVEMETEKRREVNVFPQKAELEITIH